MPSQMIRMRIEAILPKERTYPQSRFNQLIDELEGYMQGPLQRTLTRKFDETTQGWRHRPDFSSEFSRPYNGNGLQLWVRPKGPYTTQWSRVSLGTGPREIRSDSLMVFQPDYDPKTRPGGHYGGPGRKSGPVIRTHVVGTIKPHRIEPRKFSEQIKHEEEKRIISDVQALALKVTK